MEARSEIPLKFSGTLPTATPIEGKKVSVEVTDQNGLTFTAQINAKSLRKAQSSVADFSDWAGMISGKLGGSTSSGLTVIDPGIQIFDKKPKEPQRVEALATAN